MSTTVYFDLETGGVKDTDPDIQIAAIAVEDATWAELETFEQKIQFDPAKADPEALKLNSYDPEIWKRDAVPPLEAILRFQAFLNRHPSPFVMYGVRTGNPYKVAKVAGHNAALFDGPRLRRLFQNHGQYLPIDPRVRCTCQRAFFFFDERPEIAPPENFKLPTLCRYFGIEVHETHDALADVRLCIRLARAIRDLERAEHTAA